MQSTPYHLPLLVTAALAFALAGVMWRRRPAPGAAPLALLSLAVAVWAAAYLLSLSGTTLERQLFWINLTYLGITLVPASWLAFALSYGGDGARLAPRTLGLLAIMPLATHVAVWTNGLHGLFRSEVGLVRAGSFVVLEVTLGPLFWVHTAYSYILLLLGTILLLRHLARMPPAYRSQAGGLVIGVATPWVGNVLYLSGLNPFPHLDLTPFALGIAGIALAWDLLRLDLFELVPIARSTVFQSIQLGVIVLDARARIIDINPVGLALTGRELREVIGQPAGSIFADQPDIVERYRGVTAIHEELELGVGSAARAFDLRISPIYDRGNALSGRVIVLHDITERKRAAAELRRQNEQLAALALENARLFAAVQQELAERRQAEVSLSLAKEAAEVASRAKSRFLANMSHELRTPLNAILGFADLVEADARELGADSLARDVSQIQVAGRHLLSLISDVLDITRIEAEKLELHPETFDIGALVHNLAVTVTPLVEKNRNTLTLDCPADCGEMFADITRVRQVLLNVLGNAAKFTEGGQITMQVLPAGPQTNGRAPVVTFRISDTGVGIGPEQIKLLFKEFVQVDDLPTRKHGGSGLGLAISYQLCKLMGGTIAVSSAPGVGSTFTIELPGGVPSPA